MKQWRMIIEFDETNEGAAMFSKMIRGIPGPERKVKTVEVWLHDHMLRAQNQELLDAIHEIKTGIALVESSDGTAVAA